MVMTIETGNRPATRYHPRLGLLRTIVANGQVWYEARSVRKILWYGADDPLPSLETEKIIETPDGAGLFYDGSALRALAVASPAPAGLATTFLEWVKHKNGDGFCGDRMSLQKMIDKLN